MFAQISQRAHTSYLFFLAWRGLIVLLTILLLTGKLAAQSDKDVLELELGKPIERELGGGQTHSYALTLTTNQYIHIVVEQRGIDVVVTLFGPDERQIIEVDSPNGTQGPEHVLAIAEATGSYRLEVRSLEGNAIAGRYEVKVKELRAATEKDKNDVKSDARAKQLLDEASQLRAGGSKESLQQAIQKYVAAQLLFHTLNDGPRETLTLLGIGLIHNSLGEKQKALGYFTQALLVSRAAGDVSGEAGTLTYIGSVYDDLGERQKALDYYNQALPLSRTIRDRDAEALTLNSIGRIYDGLGEKQKALDYFNQALLLRRAVGDRAGEGLTLNNIGLVYADLGEKQKALDYYNQSLPLRRAAGDRAGEAGTLMNLGSVYQDLGEKQKALDYYNQSLPLFSAIGERYGEARTFSNIGTVYDELGEPQKALDYYNQALSLSRAVEDRDGEARTLNNIGLVYDELGEKQKAFDYYHQALLIFRAVGNRSGEAVMLNSIGLIYADLGEEQKALDYYNQALPLRRAVGDRSGEALTLTSIGTAYATLDEKRKALDYYNQALPLRRAVGDRDGEAATLGYIGKVYDELGEKQKALDYYNQILPMFRAIGDRWGEEGTLNNIGWVNDEVGEQQKALDYYSQALPISHTIGDRRGEATILGNIAYSESKLGKLNDALAHIEAAIAIFESLRNKIGSHELRSSFFATVQGYYEGNIALLMSLHKQQPNAGYDSKALQASERARARSLLELLVEAGADIRQDVDPKLVERERSLQQQLNARAQQQIQLQSGPHTNLQAETIAKEIENLTTELQQVEVQIRQSSPRYAALTQPQPLALKEIQTQVLNSDTILLEYSLGTDRSYLWAVTPTSITSYELPKRAEIEAAAVEFYESVHISPQESARSATTGRSPSGELQLQAQAQSEQAAARLSRMLLAPVAALLGKKRILIVADGALQYVPFAALPGPASAVTSAIPSPLIVDHEVISLPSASTLAVLRREAGERKVATKTLAVLADPVFERTDERFKRRVDQTAPNTNTPITTTDESRALSLPLTRAARDSGVMTADWQFKRLFATRREADAISALVLPAMRLEALDFAANHNAATDPALANYRFVHFATHGLLDSQHPELSGILLSMFDEQGQPQDGFLRTNEVFNLKLNADVVVLSACQTGLGKDVRGEGLVGLARGFMYAGAPRVVVSLWSVDDPATAELMTRFYRGMLVKKLRPAQALRAAQVSMLRDKRFSAPFYWAAFTLQGEWH